MSNEIVESGTTLYIIQYSRKSIVVMGETIDNAEALSRLGGTYNPNLRIGGGWVFSKLREESVKNYIQTGEIVPYIYDEKDRAKFNSKRVTPDPNILDQFFKEFRGAFEDDEDYTGESIINVIGELEARFGDVDSNPPGIFREFRGAFEEGEDYSGESIIDVIDQFREKFK